MRLLDKCIIYSSIFALFTEDFSFHYLIDVKLFYFIILFNIILLAFRNNIYLNKNFFLIVSFLIVHGLFNVVFTRSPIESLAAQILGISISSIFYYSLIKTYGKYQLINSYLKFAFWIAVIAIPMFYLRINVFLNGDRLNGILTEPAHYAAIMLPAVYILFNEKKYFNSTLIILTIILSKSSIGFIGLFLMMLIPLLKVKYFLKYSIIVFIISGLGVYYLYANWNQDTNSESSNFFIRRAKQTVESFSAINNGKFEQNANLSSYAFLSNLFITKESFMEHPFGTGIGSYKTQYEKYYPKMSPPEYLKHSELSKINNSDANSLFLRMLVDIGIFGVIFLGYFIYKSILVFKSEKKIVQQSVFFYLTLKLVREGHYFPPEFHFFLLIFLKDFNEDITCTRRFLNT